MGKLERREDVGYFPEKASGTEYEAIKRDGSHRWPWSSQKDAILNI